MEQELTKAREMLVQIEELYENHKASVTRKISEELSEKINEYLDKSHDINKKAHHATCKLWGDYDANLITVKEFNKQLGIISQIQKEVNKGLLYINKVRY